MAVAVAERVVAAVSEVIDLRGQPVRVGVSVGLAMRRQDSTVDELMYEADQAMYAAKRQGKNRVERFGTPVDAVG